MSAADDTTPGSKPPIWLENNVWCLLSGFQGFNRSVTVLLVDKQTLTLEQNV